MALSVKSETRLAWDKPNAGYAPSTFRLEQQSRVPDVLQKMFSGRVSAWAQRLGEQTQHLRVRAPNRKVKHQDSGLIPRWRICRERLTILLVSCRRTSRGWRSGESICRLCSRRLVGSPLFLDLSIPSVL